MKTLLVLRHAKSSWSNQNLSDFERPLNEKGRYDAPRMGRWIKHQDMTPELIISSAAERALTTAELVALASGYDEELKVTRQFYLASPGTYIQALRSLADNYERVMVVGHNPGMEDLVEALTGLTTGMPTAAVACIELPITSWAALKDDESGTLRDHWVPRELPANFR
ncbi:MAG: histidine phosphatase family protein [Ardenticatenales bacterium]|nr:histidine phosphatase family protein [Ardenticatenales bacterium]